MQKIDLIERFALLWFAIAFVTAVPVASAEIVIHPVEILVPAKEQSRGQLFLGIANGQTLAVDEPINDPEWADLGLWVTAVGDGLYAQIESNYFENDDDLSVNVAFTNISSKEPLYWAMRLLEGERVGPEDFFMTNSVLSWRPGDPDFFSGAWPAGVSGYLGMEIYLDLDDDPETDSPHYGWIYMGTSDTSEFYVYEYGYETTPGLRVFVPEPADVVASLFGLATLAVLVPLPRGRFTLGPFRTR